MKKVKVIESTTQTNSQLKNKYRQKRVAAYCRVSTQQEEQLNSYSTQVKYYTEKIENEPKWKFVGVYADKGITGTDTKKRDEFNKMIRACKKGWIDMIITKSISRFARNTVDCLKYVRLLKSLNVDVFFEEQGIHSIENGSEFYITVYGSLAQSESENISANVKWGKERSAKEGNVSMHYKNFLGYRKGEDGKPEIVPEEAETVRYIYKRFLAGDSYKVIRENLENLKLLSPTGKTTWNFGTIRSILTNEKYKGDALINKTYVVDCITKQIKKNNGERVMYYVEDSHPAIIDKETFAKVQEELARRTGKRKVKKVGTKTELGKYSSKYALTELLICGNCGTPYRRVTWTAHGNKKIVWRCINRLDFGQKHCRDSPTMYEDKLQRSIMDAVKLVAMQNTKLLETLKIHLAMRLKENQREKNTLDIKVRLAENQKEFEKVMSLITSDDEKNLIFEKQLTDLIIEKNDLEKQLEKISETDNNICEIDRFTELLENQPIEFSDEFIRAILSAVIVDSKDRIKVVFKDGTEVDQPIVS